MLPNTGTWVSAWMVVAAVAATIAGFIAERRVGRSTSVLRTSNAPSPPDGRATCPGRVPPPGIAGDRRVSAGRGARARYGRTVHHH